MFGPRGLGQGFLYIWGTCYSYTVGYISKQSRNFWNIVKKGQAKQASWKKYITLFA